MMPNDDKTLTTREAGIILSVSLRTVQLWVEAGVLKAWKTQGGHRRVSLDSVNEVLAERNAISSLNWNKSQQYSWNKRHRNSAVSNQYDDLRVLIAEDDEVYRDLLVFYFNQLDVPVNLTLVSNGFECLISLGKQIPHLIITDLNMPKIDGFEMIRHLSSCDAYNDVQIIAMTGLTQEHIDKNGGLPEHVRVFFKPFSFKQLEIIVGELIDH